MMRKYVSVYSSVGKIGKVGCGIVGACFLELSWKFYLGLVFCCCLDF